MERITQDMRFRQSLMRYAERTALPGPAGGTTKRRHTSTSGASAGTAASNRCERSHGGLTITQRAHGNGAQADPEYAAQEPQTRCGGTVAPAAKARLYPSRLLAIPGVAPSRHAPGGEGKEKVRRQTVPADDASWRAYCVIVSWFRSQSLSSRYSCLC